MVSPPSGRILLTKNAPHPSPRQYPSARRSNVWHLPNAESIPAAENAAVTSPVSTPAPVVTALGHSSYLHAEADRCAATSDDEHAVSTVRHGPVSPSANETRPDRTDKAPEVPEYTEDGLLSGATPEPAPWLEMLPPAPRKHPMGMFVSCERHFYFEEFQNTP